MRRGTRFVVAAAMVATVQAAIVTEKAQGSEGPKWKHTPCQYEDSYGCVWDARHMGNGEGRSFMVTPRGKYTFISHRRAHRLLGL